MAYEAHKWKIGEEITSDKLNHIEKGIEAGGDIQTNITDPQDGQTLKYDAASGKWVNGEGGGSSTLVATVNLNEQGKGTLDHTWQEIHDAMPNVIVEEKFDDSEYTISVACIGKNPNNNKPYYVESGERYYSASTPSDYPTNISGGGEES